MITLSRFTPELEIYSVDEAFLNLSGFEKRGLYEYGTEIKKIVERDTGIPVSIGIGPTKVLAKAWKMKQSGKSPRYLAGWSDIPSVG